MVIALARRLCDSEERYDRDVHEVRMNVVFAPLHLLVALVPAIIGAFILYWIIRLAVRHGIRDSRK
jgi:hypothetical protein